MTCPKAPRDGRAKDAAPRDQLLVQKILKGSLAMTDPESAALELLRVMPEDVAESLRLNPENEPLLSRIFAEWIREKHRELDLRTLQAATRYLQAGREAWRALAEARLARHQALRQEKELAQADELGDLRHRTLTLKEKLAQRWLGVEPLKRRYLEARLKARIRRLDLQFRTVEEPRRRKTLDRWEQYLRAWKHGVTGCANFESQTDEWLADYRERRSGQVAADDPHRAEKLARIEALIEELRARRDRMMRDGWSLGSEQSER